MQDLTNYLLETRKSLGLSQTKLAKELEIPQTTWASYEIGKARPPIQILVKLAQMGYPYSELTQGSASVAIEKKSIDTGLSKEEVKQQTVAHLQELAKNYQLDTSIEEVPSPEFKTSTSQKDHKNFDLFRFKKGISVPVEATENDTDALVMLPMYSQTASAGPGQTETQLAELEKYIPVVLEMLGGANPKNCGMVRVVGDSMTDMSLFNGDWAIFDRTQVDGDGVYVISIGTDVRVKRLEYRPIERKIIISSENAKRYPNPEIISYEQAESLLSIHGKVICWMHRHPY
ncbi:LexA family transcriptional regulator [Treponema pectinovorum]|uniref:LexA family transcriptional regulator n=1 Tax=Treponema pectinovorum TaxID=164 RepID=UPI0011CA6E46|nr:LexA family transcriptional regulator [Treponema pectinovorum]